MDRLQWYLPKELPSTYTYDDNFLKLVKKLTGEFKVEDYLQRVYRTRYFDKEEYIYVWSLLERNRPNHVGYFST